MSLQVWLPMTKDLRQQGLSDVEITNNGATFQSTEGKLGGCYSFDGIDDNFSYIPNVDELEAFSVAIWVCPDAAAPKGVIFGLERGTHWQFELYRNTVGIRDNSIGWNGTRKNFSTGTYIANVWTHLVVTYNNGELKVYRDGALNNTYTVGGSKLNTGIDGARIGSAVQAGYYHAGKINDFRFYDHCLSPMEVKQISQGLVLHYSLNRSGWGQENLAIKTGVRPPDQTSQVEWVGFKIGNLPITAGETITVSFDLKMEIGTAITNSTPYLYIYNTNYKGPHGQWISFVNNRSHPFIPIGNYAVGDIFEQRVHFTTTVADSFNPGSQTEDWIEFYSNYNTENKITINNLKIERGAIATPWCPNSADVLATTMGLNSTTEYDCSGFGNNGTRTGTFTWTSDTPKYSASTYIPTSSYITHACCLDNSNQEWTCCAWVKLDDTVGSQNLNDFNYSNRIIHAANGTPLLYLNAGNNDYYMYGSQKVNANEWTHIAFVFKNSTELRNVYVNGVLTNSGGPNKTSTPSGIPATVKVGGSNFAGYMSDYREYATALSASDVKALYNANKL